MRVHRRKRVSYPVASGSTHRWTRENQEYNQCATQSRHSSLVDPCYGTGLVQPVRQEQPSEGEDEVVASEAQLWSPWKLGANLQTGAGRGPSLK